MVIAKIFIISGCWNCSHSHYRLPPRVPWSNSLQRVKRKERGPVLIFSVLSQQPPAIWLYLFLSAPFKLSVFLGSCFQGSRFLGTSGACEKVILSITKCSSNETRCSNGTAASSVAAGCTGQPPAHWPRWRWEVCALCSEGFVPTWRRSSLSLFTRQENQACRFDAETGQLAQKKAVPPHRSRPQPGEHAGEGKPSNNCGVLWGKTWTQLLSAESWECLPRPQRTLQGFCKHPLEWLQIPPGSHTANADCSCWHIRKTARVSGLIKGLDPSGDKTGFLAGSVVTDEKKGRNTWGRNGAGKNHLNQRLKEDECGASHSLPGSTESSRMVSANKGLG